MLQNCGTEFQKIPGAGLWRHFSCLCRSGRMLSRSQEKLSDLGKSSERPDEVQWGMLFELAREYKKEKPWEVLSDCDIFGLKLPWMEETVYPLVMGNAGEFFGLSVYRRQRACCIIS